MQIYAHLRASYGKMISALFCSGKRKELSKLTKDTRDPKDGGTWLARESVLLVSARGHKDFNDNLALGSLFQNATLARSLYPSDKEAIEAYAATLSRVGQAEYGRQLMQWIKKGNGDVLSLFDSIVSCKTNR